jgi:secreted PhoX family phosphatase
LTNDFMVVHGWLLLVISRTEVCVENNKKIVTEMLFDHDDIPVNPSANLWLLEVATNRRQFLKGSLGLAIGGFLGGLTACDSAGVAPHNNRLPTHSPLPGFTSVAPQLSPDFDEVVVAPGYSARAFFSWGDPVVAGAPEWKADASNSWQEQELQAGQNHDGMAYFPFENAPDDHGLLVINHEYSNPTLHPSGPTEMISSTGRITRPYDEVRKEQAAHGVSVIEIRRTGGQWQSVTDSGFNRRLTAYSPMEITGPVAGTGWLKTKDDPTGKHVLGTLNNCSMGKTPWGTYLICEENWHSYFVNRNKKDWQERKSHSRYGISCEQNSHENVWESVDPRFDATPDKSQLHDGFVNEPHRFGWVVEFDPFDPQCVPKKRTALGRYARECATVSVAEDGQLAIYSGDDTRGEYVYKFVPAEKWNAQDKSANNNLLDEGILYVAVFHADGTGQWLPLVQGRAGLTADNGFVTQADVLVNTRLAADTLGATPMDRPEWVAVDPDSREVYVTLSNNILRGSHEQPVNATNPRAQNYHGHIVRWTEKNSNPAATEFTWNLFLLAGKQARADVPAHERGNIRGDLFSCPDGLRFDKDG